MDEKKLLVLEVKGLLEGVERISSDARFQLAYVNVTDIVTTTANINQILDRINQLVTPIILKELEEDNDELF